jgi:Transglutaminase-like superfamily
MTPQWFRNYGLILLSTGALLVASSPWLRAYQGNAIILVLATACLAAVLIPTISTRVYGLRLRWSVLISLVTYTLFTLLVVLHNPFGFIGLYQGLFYGTSHLLSMTLPVSQPLWLFVPAVTFPWIAGAVIGESLNRTNRVNVASFTALTLFVVSFAVTASVRTTLLFEALLLGVLVATIAFFGTPSGRLRDDQEQTSDQASHRDLDRAKLITGAVTLFALVLGLSLVVPQIPRMKTSPKSPERATPIENLSPISPTVAIAQLRGLHSTGSTEKTLFEMKVTNSFNGYVTLADLVTYNGDDWSLDQNFRASGGTISVSTGLTPPTSQQLSQSYEVVNAPPLPWMPFVSTPRSFRNISAQFDQATGMLIPTSPLVDGQQYSIVSSQSPFTLLSLPSSQLNNLSIGGLVSAEETALPQVLNQTQQNNLVTLVENKFNLSKSTPFVLLHEVQAYILKHYRTVPTKEYQSASQLSLSSQQSVHDLYGTSAADVEGALFTSTDRVVTPEQVATFMAMLARQLGIPARLATGFRIQRDRQSSVSTGPIRTFDITGAESWSWAEIDTSNFGWMVVDASSSSTGTPENTNTSGSATTTTTSPKQIVSPGASSHSAPAAKPFVVQSKTHSAIVRVFTLIVSIVLAVVAVYFCVLQFIKFRRRRLRRNVGTPNRRTAAAWEEALDTLDESSLRGLQPLTNSEILSQVSEMWSSDIAETASPLAQLASIAVFDPQVTFNEKDVQAAWKLHAEFIRELQRQQSLGAKLNRWTHLATGSFRRRSKFEL